MKDCSDLDDGLAKIADDRCALILLDQNMPVMDGLSFLTELHAILNNVANLRERIFAAANSFFVVRIYPEWYNAPDECTAVKGADTEGIMANAPFRSLEALVSDIRLRKMHGLKPGDQLRAKDATALPVEPACAKIPQSTGLFCLPDDKMAPYVRTV